MGVEKWLPLAKGFTYVRALQCLWEGWGSSLIRKGQRGWFICLKRFMGGMLEAWGSPNLLNTATYFQILGITLFWDQYWNCHVRRHETVNSTTSVLSALMLNNNSLYHSSPENLNFSLFKLSGFARRIHPTILNPLCYSYYSTAREQLRSPKSPSMVNLLQTIPGISLIRWFTTSLIWYIFMH